MKTKSRQKNKGFTMLFAVLISSILLSIGIAILDLSLKEYTLSSTGRESQIAFYAADDGMECALYWDHNSINSDSSPTFSTSSIPVNFDCNGNYVTWEPPGNDRAQYQGTQPSGLTSGVTGAKSSFWLTYDVPVSGGIHGETIPPCAYVEVTKIDTAGKISTQIVSRGYNTCGEVNRVERAIQANY